MMEASRDMGNLCALKDSQLGFTHLSQLCSSYCSLTRLLCPVQRLFPIHPPWTGLLLSCLCATFAVSSVWNTSSKPTLPAGPLRHPQGTMGLPLILPLWNCYLCHLLGDLATMLVPFHLSLLYFHCSCESLYPD